MSVQRPSYIPNRLDWFPGDPTANRQVQFREASNVDEHQVRALLALANIHPSRKVWSKWLYQNDYCVTVACRNARTAIAVSVVHVQPSGVNVIACVVHPSYARYPIEERLLFLAALELPERPTKIVVAATDLDRQKRLKALRWQCGTINAASDTYEFTHRFVTTGTPGTQPNRD